MVSAGPRIGSLFTGIGALDLAVEAVYGGRVVWQSEVDFDACRVLRERWPGVRNLGDISAIDWATVPEIDILAGGFPCTDTSQAGRKEGIGGARSGLWSFMAEAVRYLRPRLVVVENVAGLRHRGFDVVLGDLAAAGFDAAWTSLRAADVGAPHLRERVFLVAWAADAKGDGRFQGRPEPAGLARRPDAALGGGAVADADGRAGDGRADDARRGPLGRAAAGRDRPAGAAGDADLESGDEGRESTGGEEESWGTLSFPR
ncbi:DNA cytosine methyltransferase [Nonomuraea sp. LPB2021202275-12-8]|uniref:DNA cytosine methyltransferase n=1 Tax=Nonomuraea sp. LPB2021202275-12-8 TaxID=3120159 RepID=UPI00300C5392